MPEIIKPLPFDDLPVKPPFVGRPKISDDIQQTAALLVGWDKSTRRLVSVSPTGVLHVASPPVKGILNIQADGDGYTWNGGDISTSEVLVRAKLTTAVKIWVNVGAVAGDNVGYPLGSGEWVNFSINNLHSLNIYFEKDDDWAIIIYTK